MLKMLGFFLKMSIFAIVILVLGNWIHWEGRTISDQVRLKMAHAERSDLMGTVRGWADRITQDAKAGFQKKLENPQDQEEHSESERQKLKALIRDLNSTHRKN